MRTSSALVAVMLAGCQPAEVDDPGAAPLDCALDGSGQFASICTATRVEREGRSIATVRAPDGRFRRLELVGNRIVAADGAEEARVTQRSDGTREVAIGDDRFLIPAPR